MARAVKWAGIAIALAVLVFAGMAYALHRWLATDDFRQRVEREGSAALGVPLRVGAISIDVWPLPAVAVDKLEVATQPPLTVTRVEARPVWRALLQQRLEISTLVVREAVLPQQGIAALSTQAQKKPGAVKAPPKGSSDAMDWLPRRMLLDRITWIDAQGVPMTFDAQAQLDDAGVPQTASFKVLQGRFAGAQGKLQREGDAWPLRVDIGGGKVTGRFQVQPGTAGLRVLRGELDTENVEVAELTAPSRTLTGRLQAQTTLRAEFRDPAQIADAMQTQTKFSVRNAVVRGIDLAAAVKTVGMSRGGETRLDTLAGQVATQGRTVHLTNLVANSGVLAATGNVTLSPNKSLGGRVDVALAASQGTVGVPLVVGGTLDAPSVTLSRAALAGAAIGTLLAPGAGTAAGASLGDKVGDKLKGLFGR